MEPWARRDDETAKAYEAFMVYLEQGAQRSVREVGKALDKSHTLISRWSGKYDWPSRVRAYDSVPAQATVDAYADMARDIAEQHRALSDKLMKRLSENVDLLPSGADPSIKWSTAHNAARQGHAFATDLSKPADTQREEITKAIENLISKLAGE